MKVLNTYTSAWKFLLLNKKIWLILFSSNFIFALIVASPLNAFLSDSIGNSLILNSSKSLFDYSFIIDFLNEYGSGISGILKVSKWILFLFILLSIFFTGGILESLRHKAADFGTLLVGGIKYFWSLLGIVLVFLILHAICFLLMFKIFESLLGGFSPFGLESDAVLIRSAWIITPCYLILCFFIFLWSDLSKLSLLHAAHKNIFKAIARGFKLLIRKFRLVFPFYFLILFTFVLISFVYHIISGIWELPSGFSLVFLIIVTQIFILFRVGIKLVNLYGLNQLTKEWHHE